MRFFGFGRDNDRPREHREFAPPLSKKAYWDQAGQPKVRHSQRSFDRTPRPDHRQQTPRTTRSAQRTNRGGMGGKRIY